MNLTLNLWDVRVHAEEYMKQQGIKYFISMASPISDSWVFWCCKNVPEPLPRGLSLLKARPYFFKGRGINKFMYHQIKNQSKNLRKGKKAQNITKGGEA